MADKPAFTNVPRVGLYNFTTADTGTINVVTGGTNGSRIKSVILHNKATTAREVYVSLTDGTNTYRLSAVSVNNTGNTTQELLGTAALVSDANGNNFVTIPNNSYALTVSLNAAVGTNNDVSVAAFGEDF